MGKISISRLLDLILNLGVKPEYDVQKVRLIRQVNGLNAFYTGIASSAGILMILFVPGAEKVAILQMSMTVFYFCCLLINASGRLKLAGTLTIYVFEWHMFMIMFLTNLWGSPAIFLAILFPLLAALVEVSIIRHLFVCFIQVILLIALHYTLPEAEKTIIQFSSMNAQATEVLKIMAIFYVPIMSATIMLIIFRENMRARERQKEMQQKEIKFTENKKYLDNINEGLLMINQDMIISGQYSKFILYLFNMLDITEKNLLDLLFPDGENQAKDRAALINYIHILFTNQTAADDMLKDANPLLSRVITLKDPNAVKNEKYVKLSFQRIYSDDKKEIENIMVLFEDKTNIILQEKELEKERVRKANEVESVTAILKQGPQVFFDFIQETRNTLNVTVFNTDNLNNKERINQIFGDLHSLKGFARILELSHMAEGFHECENIMTMIRDNENNLDEFLRITLDETTEEILKDIREIEMLLNKLVSFQRFDHKAGESKTRVFLDSFILSLQDMILSISREVSKEVEFVTHITVDEFPHLKKLRNAIIHLIRNAVDHGVEDTLERLSLQKDTKGLIILEIYKDDHFYNVEVSDDGSGLNYDLIKRKAIEKHIISEDDTDITHDHLINIMFSPEFSSRDKVTANSGRGIGLNVVARDIKNLHGKIIVSTQKGKGTKFKIQLPLS